jgi:hypothetical protein
MIRSSPEYQALADQREATEQQRQADVSPTAAVAPVLTLEKGDLEFWTQVTTLIVLVLIYSELRRQGGR